MPDDALRRLERASKLHPQDPSAQARWEAARHRHALDPLGELEQQGRNQAKDTIDKLIAFGALALLSAASQKLQSGTLRFQDLFGPIGLWSYTRQDYERERRKVAKPKAKKRRLPEHEQRRRRRKK